MSFHILHELTVPGRRLVFCDDTDLDGQPVPEIVPDLRIVVAVEMGSDAYVGAHQRITGRLAELGMSRFHATEVANPGSRSEWNVHAPKAREEALAFLVEVFSSCGATTSHVRVSKEEYGALKATALTYGDVSLGLKAGLKRVLVRSLAEKYRTSDRPVMVVLDREKAGDAPAVDPQWPEAAYFVGGGPVVAPSETVAGLQLADLAAWSIGRYLRKRSEMDVGRANRFDLLAARTVAGMNRLGNLLS